MEKAKQIPYRAIALDLDGTLTNHEKVVTPKTREALLKAASEGAVIILASGRPTYGIEPVAECLELNQRGGYILSYNGGNIVNAQTGEKLFSQFLPDEVIPELYAYAKEKGHALLGYAGNEIITEMPDDEYVKEASSYQASHDWRPYPHAQGGRGFGGKIGRQNGYLPLGSFLPGVGT